MVRRSRFMLIAGAAAAAMLVAGCLLESPTPAPNATQAADESSANGSISTPTPASSAGNTSDGQVSVTPAPRMQNVQGHLVKQYPSPPLMTIDTSANYTATIRTNQGPFTVDLFASQAPKTVNSFVFLAQDGFYDGVIFHRVIPEFMIQGGDPTGTGFNGPGYRYEDEIDASLVFDGSGILAMANSGPGTNGSQFFITVAATPQLNGIHTIFGRVTSGQDIVTGISLVGTDPNDRPVNPVIIQSIEILKNGS